MPSALIATYSGSRSLAAVVPVLVEMRIPKALSSASRPFRAVKPTVATVELAGVSALIVITEIVPSGSTV